MCLCVCVCACACGCAGVWVRGCVPVGVLGLSKSARAISTTVRYFSAVVFKYHLSLV